MNLWWMTFLAGALLAVAGYAQYQLERFTAGRGKTWLARTTLMIVGIAFGFTLARTSASVPGAAALFLIGVGLVHLPAAFILFLKRERGSGPT